MPIAFRHKAEAVIIFLFILFAFAASGDVALG